MNLDFIPVVDIPFVDIPVDWMEFDQPLEKLEKLGFDSRSTFVNNVSLIVSFIGVILLHIFIKVLLRCNNSNHPNKFIRNFSILKTKILDLFMYVIYVRWLLEAHETMVISSTLEIKELAGSSAASIVSEIIAALFLLICLIIPTVALVLFYRHREMYDPNEKYIMMEFFAGLKNTKWARFYTFLMLFRRVVFVAIVIFASENVNRSLIFFFLLF